jgi:hypothetical protein
MCSTKLFEGGINMNSIKSSSLALPVLFVIVCLSLVLPGIGNAAGGSAETGAKLPVTSASTASGHSADVVSFSLLPAGKSFKAGETVDIEIQVHAGPQKLNSVDAHLDYDPAVLKINKIAGIDQTGWTEMQSKFDSSKGTVDYAAVSFGSGSGDFSVCKINVTLLADAKSPLMKFVFEPRTRQTRAEFNGTDYCKGNVNE